MSKWNKYRLKDFAIDKNGKPYLYASFNTYGLRGVQPQKKAVFFPSKILDEEYVIVPKDRVDELERDVDWKVKFPTALESIQTKEIDIVPKSVVEEIEGMPLETDKFSLLSQAIQVENDSVIFYQNLMEIFPEWREVLQDITNEELKHIGQLEALRNEQPQVGQKVEEGENEADAQMKGIAVEGVDRMKGQMNYQGLGAKESYYTDAEINAAFEDFEDEHIGKSSRGDFQVSPQKNLKLAKVPEGVGVESNTNLSDEQSKINNLSDNNADSLASQLQKIANEDDDWEDEEADESFTKDEAESEDPEAKEACACEAYSEECTRLALNIEDAESDDDLANCEAEIETAHANGDITEEEFNYLFGVINSKR